MATDKAHVSVSLMKQDGKPFIRVCVKSVTRKGRMTYADVHANEFNLEKKVMKAAEQCAIYIIEKIKDKCLDPDQCAREAKAALSILRDEYIKMGIAKGMVSN